MSHHHDTVTARLLGAPSFTRNGRAVQVPPGSARLLAFLLTRPGRTATRTQLRSALEHVDSESVARRRLNTSVWRLRCALEPDGAPREDVVTTTRHGLRIAPGCEVWVDVEEFDRDCRVARAVAEWTDADADVVGRGLAHYAGDFLDGEYDEWALAERSRLADVHVSALLRMVHWHELAGRAEPALEYARVAAATEPLREDLQRLLMRQYRLADLPEMAAQHYEAFRRLLADELGVEPLPETREAGLGRPGPEPARLSAQHATRTFLEVLGELERTREELRVITGQVEHSIAALRGQLVPHQRPR